MRQLGLVITLAFSLLVAPLAAGAQPAAPAVRRIGVIFAGGGPEFPPGRALRQGLAELGYVEDQTIAIEWRSAQGRYERFPDLVAELVRLRVDIILAGSMAVALSAKRATNTIPIVAPVLDDPVAAGLVASLARPGGNVTGLTAFIKELSAKRLELLKEATPSVSRVAALWNPANPTHPGLMRETQVAAQSLGLNLQPVEARASGELDEAFRSATRGRAQALIELQDAMFFREQRRIAGLALRSRLPMISGDAGFAGAGGLMVYGPSVADNWRRSAAYIDKIFKGAKPADLPVEQPTKLELVINLKTAKTLGVTIPQSILLRADELIQ